MGIYLGDKQGTLYKGSYKPVNLYHGDKKAAGWELSEKTGTELSWDDTYNDKILSAVVEGKSEQEQTVQGKNLCGYTAGSLPYTDWGSGVTFSHDNGLFTIQGTTGAGQYPYIKFYTIKANTLPNGTYRVSNPMVHNNGTRAAGTRIIDRTELPYPINASGQFTISGGHNDLFVELTATQNATYDCSFYVQIEKNTVATPYEPFVPNSPSPDYPSTITSAGDSGGIDLAVTGYAGQTYSAHRDVVLRSLPDGTHDTWDVVTGTVTRNVGVKVFDGNEDFIINVYAFDNFGLNYYQWFWYSGAVRPAGEFGYCTHFDVVPWLTIRDNVVSYITNNGVIFRTDGVQSVSDFKSWLAAQYAAGTPVTVLYQLAEPTIEQIDPLPLPTYPRYTALSCNAEVTASVRVIEHGL